VRFLDDVAHTATRSSTRLIKRASKLHHVLPLLQRKLEPEHKDEHENKPEHRDLHKHMHKRHVSQRLSQRTMNVEGSVVGSGPAYDDYASRRRGENAGESDREDV